MTVVDTVIIGGGITGLATAYYLQEQARSAGKAFSYVVIESSSRLGGKITTHTQDGFVIEGGPDCFLSQKPWAADLCRTLGIGDDLMGTNDARRRVFIVNKGRLTPLPDGVMLIVPTKITPFLTSGLITWPGKLRMGLDLVIPRRRDGGDESVGSFVRRRLGQEALDKIAEPLMSGIHVSDPNQQSLLGTFPRFRDIELKHGSLIRGMLSAKRSRGHAAAAHSQPASLFMTLRGGLIQLIDSLERVLDASCLLRGSPATWIERNGGLYRVAVGRQRWLHARSVVLATPAYVSADLVQDFAPEMAAMLRAIRYISTATITLAYTRQAAGHLTDGFGFVVPRREHRTVSACTWTSTKFHHRAPQNHVLLRAFAGGPGHEDAVSLSDDELVQRVKTDLERIMGLRADPVLTRIYRWPRANPQYDVGHPDRMARLRSLCAEHPGLFVIGSAFDGVGVPDCVRQGKQTASSIIGYLSTAKPLGQGLLDEQGAYAY